MHTVLKINLPGEIAEDDSIRLIDLAKRFHVCASTCFRWVIKGLPTGDGSRVRLEAIKRGKCWLTSEAAVKRFFASLPQSGSTPAAKPTRPSSKIERDSAGTKQAIKDKYGL